MIAQSPSPKTSPLDLSEVLDALSDPTRRRILLQLTEKDFCCGSFEALGPKTRLTYHFNRLRQAGLIQSARDGRYLILTLRRKEIESTYPGLLQSVLRAAKNEVSSDRDSLPTGRAGAA